MTNRLTKHLSIIREQISQSSSNINIIDSNNDNNRENDAIDEKFETNVIEQNNKIDVENQKQKIKFEYDSFKDFSTKSNFNAFTKKIRT
jgi:uncharacterized protein (DUF342 family)